MADSRTHFIALVSMIAVVYASAAYGDSESALLGRTVESYCADCHDADQAKGGLDLSLVSGEDVTRHPEIWERVIRRLRGRQMPPAGKPRPDEATYTAVLAALEKPLDAQAAVHPHPGRTDTLRRLTRTEYQNAVRDLLAVDIDAASLLPADESSHGFDNITVGTLSPTLLERYISAAQKISRQAVGGVQRSVGGDTFRVPADITQEEHVEGLPLGTRGGTLIHYTFPRDGEYELQVRLARDRNEEVEGLKEPHELVVLLDRDEKKSFTVEPPKGKGWEGVDAHLKLRLNVKAGPRDIGVTFVKNPSSLLETLRQPYNAHFNMHRHPRISPAVYQVSIAGPFEDAGPGDTPSRKKLFVAWPTSVENEAQAAKQILSGVMRRAYRRPVDDADVERVIPFFTQAREASGFEAGIESAVSAILVSREFLFRVERDPADASSQAAYAVSDLELASRLSFFLWSSIPDDELLDTAARGHLHEPAELEKQTRRMLADPRSQSLVGNFANQWLHLRNLQSITPDGRLFPDFDDNLRQAFRQETELCFGEMLQDDASVMSLLKSDHTWLNERLAKHYGIPNIYGSQFRKVALDSQTRRGGLLRQGSILTVTSYATRTSPTIRGKWVLDNLLGLPPPPPPPNVPALDNGEISEALPIRERLAQHRANAACASCHNQMDPVGFALENFDAVGRWRTAEDGVPVDNSSGLPDGSRFAGVAGLEDALLQHPEIFASTLTEKLMTFALGRGVEFFDAPAVRQVVRHARENDYRFSALVVGIVQSRPFRLRESEAKN